MIALHKGVRWKYLTIVLSALRVLPLCDLLFRFSQSLLLADYSLDHVPFSRCHPAAMSRSGSK